MTTRRVAHIWWCGDYACDCQQAVVEDVASHPDLGPPFVMREQVAVGTFFSGCEGYPNSVVERDHLALLYGAETLA